MVEHVDGDVVPPRVVQGFEAFYVAEWPVAVRLATMLTGSVHIAEEVAQECFLAIGERWAELDRPQAYLRVAIGNASKNYLRKQVLRRSRGWRPDASMGLEAGELWDALRGLPSRQRSAVVLRYYGDLPLAEVATVLGCAEGTAASLVHRGLKALRQGMEP